MSIVKCTIFFLLIISLNKIESSTIDIQASIEKSIQMNRQIEREKYLKKQQYHNIINDIAARYNTNVNVIKYIYDITKQNGVDFYIMLALIDKESNFRSWAKSKSNAIGYCQIKNIVVRDIKRTDLDIYNPEDNILIGTLFLKELQTRYKFDILNALIFYNTGSIKSLRQSGYKYATSILRESDFTRNKYSVTIEETLN